MNVPFLDLKAELHLYRDKVEKRWQEVIDNTRFVGSVFVKEFEDKFAAMHGDSYCIATNNGTTSLVASLMALEIRPGDKVILPANSFFATAEAVSILGAKIVFVDVDPKTHLMDLDELKSAMSSDIACVIPVHLYGQMVDMKSVSEIVKPFGSKILEDAAQAQGAQFDAKSPGTHSDMASYSFYPGKNLGSWGEAGAIVTKNEALAQKARYIANHGSKTKYDHICVGGNFRMSELQGAVLAEKIEFLPQFTKKRREHAQYYLENIKNNKLILPFEASQAKHVWHLFVVKTEERTQLQGYLSDQKIASGIHYPVALHKTNAYLEEYGKADMPISEEFAQQILSLPMYPMLTDEQRNLVVKAVNKF